MVDTLLALLATLFGTDFVGVHRAGSSGFLSQSAIYEFLNCSYQRMQLQLIP